MTTALCLSGYPDASPFAAYYGHRHHGSPAAPASAVSPPVSAKQAHHHQHHHHHHAASSAPSPSLPIWELAPAVPPAILSISPPVHKRGSLAAGLAYPNGHSHGHGHGHHPSPINLPLIHSASITETFRKVLSDVDLDDCEPAGENAFMVCDLKRVWDKYQLWQSELGDRVEAFFAVKCNPDPVILQMMARLGLGFDCASHAEIASVLAYGVSPDKIIYANPCKAASFVRHAARHGVRMMTFDNADELVKVKRHHPGARMVLRILTDDSGSLCRLGLKFGAPLSEVRGLLRRARALAVDVVGVSFHVGSGCTNPELFADAVRRARWAFDVAREEGFELDLLDVGGGFGGDNFSAIAAVLRPAIEKLFPREDGVRVIAEPGRYFVTEAFEMATNIIARRGKASPNVERGEVDLSSDTELADDLELELEPTDAGADGAIDAAAAAAGEQPVAADPESGPMVMYYINDGVYGSFNCTMFDHQVVHPRVLTLDGAFVPDPSAISRAEDEPCSVWGPTCDSIDCVSKCSYLPTARIAVGDWLRWENMGAYTICAASQFNGFKQAKVVYCIDAEPFTEAQIRHALN